MSALYLTESRRIYRPAEAPDSAKEKACQIEAEGLDASWISEGVFGTCDETGIRGDLARVGVKLETDRKSGPFWSLYPHAVSMTGSVADIGKFLVYLQTEGKLDRNEVRRLLYVEREGGISLSMRRQRGYGEGTVADADFGSVDYPSPEINEACASLAELWADFVRDVVHKAGRALEAEIEHVTKWETIAERLQDMGEGIDDSGRAWSLADCEERDETDETEEEA